MASIRSYPFITIETIYSIMFDWSHLKSNNINYCAHMRFAVFVSLRLLITVLLLLLHAFVPFIKIPRKFNIAGASDYLFDKDFETKERRFKAVGLYRKDVQS